MSPKRKRDYKAEYQRRIQRALEKGYSRRVARGHPARNELGIRAAAFVKERPGTPIRDVIIKDRKRVFGKRPKIKKGENIPAYMLRLAELKKQDGQFDWDNEAAFIEQMQAMGLTIREAYSTLGGSPPI